MDDNVDWTQVDPRVLGKLLSAQNLLFVLPDTARIAEYYAQALVEVPGILSCRVCLGKSRAPRGDDEVCGDCRDPGELRGGIAFWPSDFSCAWAARAGFRVLALRTRERGFGFFIFNVDSSGRIEAYWPFLANLANYVALSLENRIGKALLEQARDELEAKNRELIEMNRLFVGRELRMIELKERIAGLEAENGRGEAEA